MPPHGTPIPRETPGPPCPDDPNLLTTAMLPELADMTPEQRETLGIKWDVWEGETVRVASWNEHTYFTKFAVLRETFDGCRADERIWVQGDRPNKPFPRDD